MRRSAWPDGLWPPGTQVYGGGYGYGMYAYPIVIETVTTSGSGGYIEEVTEEFVQTSHRRRAHRARPRARCACTPRVVYRQSPPRVVYRTVTRPAPRPAPPPRRPRPPAGERG